MTAVLPDDSPAVDVRPSTVKVWVAWTLRVLGLVALLFVVAVGVISYGQLGRLSWQEDVWAADRVTVVLGSWFPTWWDLAIWPAMLGFVALIASAVTRPKQGTVPRRVLRGAVTATVVILAGLSLIVAGVATAVEIAGRAPRPGYIVLPETSAGGCRIVADEGTSLRRSGGSVGIIQPGSIVVDWVRSYRAEAVRTPFSKQEYTIAWNGPVAELRPGAASWSTDTEIRCDR